MRKAFRTLFKYVVYLIAGVFVFTRAFDATDPSLGLVLVLTAVSFFIGFVANLKGVVLRPLALVASLLVMVFVVAAPFGNWPDTDNFFWLAYGLGYFASPIANLKWNIVDKRLGKKTEQNTSEH